MPAYDYRCQACKHVFEKTQRITEAPAATCPQCGGTDCARLITGGAFHLKGGGWYASDYGGKRAPVEAAESCAAKTDGQGCGSGACGVNSSSTVN